MKALAATAAVESSQRSRLLAAAEDVASGLHPDELHRYSALCAIAAARPPTDVLGRLEAAAAGIRSASRFLLLEANSMSSRPGVPTSLVDLEQAGEA